MTRKILPLLILICFYSSISNADMPPGKELLVEYLWDPFPPENWSLISSNPNQTWKSVDSAFGGTLVYPGGYYFAFVQGDTSLPSNELLISYPLEVPSDCLKHTTGAYNIEISLVYSTRSLYNPDYTFSYEFSRTPYPEWDIFFHGDVDMEQTYPEWYTDNHYLVFDTPYPTNFWAGFRFSGTDLNLNAGFAMVEIDILCEDFGDDDDDNDTNDDSEDDSSLDDDTLNDDIIDDDDFSDDDDNFDDDMTDDDQSNDDTSGSDISDDNNSGKACGC